MNQIKAFRYFLLIVISILAFDVAHAGFLDGESSDEQPQSAPRRMRRNGASSSRSYQRENDYQLDQQRESQRGSLRSYRRPAAMMTTSQNNLKFGVAKSFYGNEGYAQTIGGFFGYSQQQTGAVGYSVLGNFNFFEKNVNAARADLNVNYGFARSFVGFAGLNINQFFASNLNGLNPGLGFQIGVELPMNSQWGIQGVFHKLTGTVTTSNGVSNSNYSFETSGVELATYMNF